MKKISVLKTVIPAICNLLRALFPYFALLMTHLDEILPLIG